MSIFVGSINPTDYDKIVNYSNYKKYKKFIYQKTFKGGSQSTQLRYSLSFVSLISPGNMVNVRLALTNFSSSKKKLLLKQSYLLLTWVYYLTRSNNKFFKKPSISIKPIKQSKFTSLKAPMAHKTFSQEQYWIRFYHLQINFTVRKPELRTLDSVNASFYVLLLLRSSLPLIETNLMLLKCFSFRIPSSDYTYFTLKRYVV